MKYQIRTRENGKWYIDPPIELDLDWKERLIKDKSDYWNVPYWQMKLIVERGAYPYFVELCGELSKLDYFKK